VYALSRDPELNRTAVCSDPKLIHPVMDGVTRCWWTWHFD